MTDPLGAIRPQAAAVLLTVRLTPRAGHDRVDGFETLSSGQTVLAARVRAIPDKGEANAALVNLIAKTLGVARSDIHVASGATSRVKILKIAGDPDGLCRRLTQLVVS